VAIDTYYINVAFMAIKKYHFSDWESGDSQSGLKNDGMEMLRT
jgi:hypothetical protein